MINKIPRKFNFTFLDLVFSWTEIGCRVGANRILKQNGQREAPIILYNPWIDADNINDMTKHSRNVTNVFF